MSKGRLAQAFVRVCDADTTLRALMTPTGETTRTEVLDEMDVMDPDESPLRFLGYVLAWQQLGASGDLWQWTATFTAVCDADGGGRAQADSILEQVEALILQPNLYNGGSPAAASADTGPDLILDWGESPMDTERSRGVVARQLVLTGRMQAAA